MGQKINTVRDLPPQVVELMLQEHHPSWVSLSSPYRTNKNTNDYTYRHPELSSWIQLEDG